MLRVIGWYTQANLCSYFKSSIFGKKDNVGWLERVLGRQEDAAVVDATLEVSAGRACSAVGKCVE
jgi:hypothetical protein